MCTLGAQDLTDHRNPNRIQLGCLRAIRFDCLVQPTSRRPRSAVSRSPAGHPGASGPVRRNQAPIRAHRRQKGVQRLRPPVQDCEGRGRWDLHRQGTSPRPDIRGEPGPPPPVAGARPRVEARPDIGVLPRRRPCATTKGFRALSGAVRAVRQEDVCTVPSNSRYTASYTST